MWKKVKGRGGESQLLRLDPNPCVIEAKGGKTTRIYRGITPWNYCLRCAVACVALLCRRGNLCEQSWRMDDGVISTLTVVFQGRVGERAGSGSLVGRRSLRSVSTFALFTLAGLIWDLICVSVSTGFMNTIGALLGEYPTCDPSFCLSNKSCRLCLPNVCIYFI